MAKRKPKEIKMTYHYVGNDSPKLKAEAEKRVDAAFDILFDEIHKRVLEEDRGKNKK